MGHVQLIALEPRDWKATQPSYSPSATPMVSAHIRHSLHETLFSAETVTVYLALRFIILSELARIQKHKEILDVNKAQAINSYSSITEEGF